MVRDERVPDEQEPPAYARGKLAAPAAEPSPAAARIALILGIASVPMSICVIGGLLGILAVLASRNAGPGLGPALLGRIFGLIGIALSAVVAIALVYVLNQPVGP